MGDLLSFTRKRLSPSSSKAVSSKPKEYRDNLYDIRTGKHIPVSEHHDWLDWINVNQGKEIT